MSYKFKSLLYLTCFVASALVYYNLEQEATIAETNEMIGMADTDSADQEGDEVHVDEFTY